MALGLAFGLFGLFLLAMAAVVLGGIASNQRENRGLGLELQALEAHLRTPEERALVARQLEAVEDQKRRIHGRFGHDGT